MDRIRWMNGIALIACAVVGITAAEAASAAPLGIAPPIGRTGPNTPLLSRNDLWYGFATLGLTALAASNDPWLTQEGTEASSPSARGFASLVRPLGSAGVVAAALGLTYVGAHVMNRPETAHRVFRVGVSVASASAFSLVLKEAIGRARPINAPGDSDRFRPFSGNSSFPSGHATAAFALAAAVSHETRARWVPWVLYPAAAAVAWSRVRDERHWTSDVVAGALLGSWVARKTDRLLRHDRGATTSPASLLPSPMFVP